MLAAVWGCEKMSKYLHGLPLFVLQTDHKPLIPILNYKLLSEMSPRIQRLRTRMLRFSYTAEYVLGTSLKDANALSRAPVHVPSIEDEIAEKEIAFHVNSIIDSIPATDSRLSEIRRELKVDKSIQEVIKMVKEGWPENKSLCSPEVQLYWGIQDELTDINGLLLRGSRLVIPKSLRRSILEKIHTGHLGIEKCRRRARQSIYWPGINNQVDQMIKRCQTCLELLPSKKKEPLNPHEIPGKPWVKVGTDLFQYGKNNYLVLMDYYSLWPEVYQLKTPNAECVIKATKEAFSRHGVAEEIISDNGTLYTSYKYKRFTKQWQFKHKTSSPHYPKSNGLAEAAVKSLIKKCNRSKQDLFEGLLSLETHHQPLEYLQLNC